MRLLSTFFLVLLTSCVARIGKMETEELAQAAVVDLCFNYATWERDDAKIRPELERRNIFTQREWEAIEQHRIFIGMSEFAFQCSWPPTDPKDFFGSGSFSKEGPWGDRTVYIYWRRGMGMANLVPGAFPKRVNVENGVVVSFQEASITRVRSDCFSNRKRDCFDFDGLVSTEVSDALLPK